MSFQIDCNLLRNKLSGVEAKVLVPRYNTRGYEALLERIQVVLLSEPSTYVKNSSYVELYTLMAKAKNILKEYKKAKTFKIKRSLIDKYIYLCSEIRKLEEKIHGYKNNKFSGLLYKIAINFKLYIYCYTLNLRFHHRRIIRFLFKNMDDNSGDVNFFQQILIEKNFCNQNNFPYETKSISRFNKQNR